MRKSNFVIIALTIIVASCGVSKKTSAVATPANAVEFSQADIDKAKIEFPDLTLADLTAGKQIYTSKCNTCHALKKVTDFNVDSWKKIVPNMVQMANNKTANAINLAQQQQLLKYVVSTVLKKQ